MKEEMDRLEKENTILRGLVAKYKPECIYCGETEMGKCTSGFPGCAKMDDIMAAECLADRELQVSLAASQETIREIEEEGRKTRLVLLLNHGHKGQYLDDGEMQCSQCGAVDYDFKIAPLSELTKRVLSILLGKVKELEAKNDRLLLHPSDPDSPWQGIKKEVKLWEARALKLEAENDRLREALDWALRNLKALTRFGSDGDAFIVGTYTELAGFVAKYHAAQQALKGGKP